MTVPSDILEQDKRRAIASMIEQMYVHDITLPELEEALKHAPQPAAVTDSHAAASTLIMRLAGIFMVTGIATYITLFWPDMNSMWRVLVTLGTGLLLHPLALKTLGHDRFVQASTPLLLAGMGMEMLGFFVMMKEIFPLAPDLRYGVMGIMAVLAVQEGILFLRHRLPVLLVAALFCCYGFVAVLLDVLGTNEDIVMIVLGMSLLLVAHGLAITRYAVLSEIGYGCGACALNSGLFGLTQGGPYEAVLLLSAGGGMVLGMRLRSTVLLMVSILTLLAYSSYFTATYFIHTVGWPFALVLLGVIYAGAAYYALQLRKRLKA
jgi:hypothetical protein